MTKADETARGGETMERLGLFQDFAWKNGELSIVNR